MLWSAQALRNYSLSIGLQLMIIIATVIATNLLLLLNIAYYETSGVIIKIACCQLRLRCLRCNESPVPH